MLFPIPISAIWIHAGLSYLSSSAAKQLHEPEGETLNIPNGALYLAIGFHLVLKT